MADPSPGDRVQIVKHWFLGGQSAHVLRPDFAPWPLAPGWTVVQLDDESVVNVPTAWLEVADG